MAEIDARIPMAYRPAESGIESPLESAAKVTKLKTAQLEQQGMQLEQQQKLQNYRDQEQLKQVLAQHIAEGGDPNDTPSLLKKIYPVNPMLGIRMQQQWSAEEAKRQKAALDAAKAEHDLMKQRQEHAAFIAQGFGGILNAPEDQQEQLYKQMRQDWLDRGLATAKDMKPDYDRDWMTAVHTGLTHAAKPENLHMLKDVEDPVTGASGTLLTSTPGFYKSSGKAEKPSAEADKERYRQLVADKALGKPVKPEDAAWMRGFEQEKLIGPESSQAAATERQTRTIGAQIAMENKRETNRRQEVGLKELTDKVERPYLDATQQANTLRDVVTAAQAGNKLAASMQSLETTMAAIRAQGLNRINTAEIKVPAGAGNAWDHIVGWFGQKVEGQPIPPNIQKDMLAFADILDQSARKKYEQGHKSVKQRYGLDEQPLPAPPAAGSPPPAADGWITTPSGLKIREKR